MILKIVSPPSPYKGKRFAVLSPKNSKYFGDYVKVSTKTKSLVFRVVASNKITDEEIGISKLYFPNETEADVEPEKVKEANELIVKTPLKIDGFDEYIRKMLYQQVVYEGEKIYLPFIHGKVEIEIKKVGEGLGYIGKSTVIVLV